MAEPPTPFSVIVPVHNDAEALNDCLTSLVGQDYPRECFEVIVVDDGSTDETAPITEKYPVRLIRLESNRGRMVARNTGAQAARYETLVFNDVRVTPGLMLLAQVNQRHYQPLMPETDAYNGSKWGYERFFFLLRSRLYAPYYPAPEDAGEYMITTENFNAVPKGTGCFVCDRTLWLQSQPAVQDKFTSDDTRILREIVEHRPILRTHSIRVRYRQRAGIGSVLRHVFQRGPLFADFYIRSGGRYRSAYLVVWTVLAFSLFGMLYHPGLCSLFAGVLFTGLLMAAAYMGRRWMDIPLVCLYLPPLALSFGLGILKWQITAWRK